LTVTKKRRTINFAVTITIWQ